MVTATHRLEEEAPSNYPALPSTTICEPALLQTYPLYLMCICCNHRMLTMCAELCLLIRKKESKRGKDKGTIGSLSFKDRSKQQEAVTCYPQPLKDGSPFDYLLPQYVKAELEKGWEKSYFY